MGEKRKAGGGGKTLKEEGRIHKMKNLFLKRADACLYLIILPHPGFQSKGVVGGGENGMGECGGS